MSRHIEMQPNQRASLDATIAFNMKTIVQFLSCGLILLGVLNLANAQTNLSRSAVSEFSIPEIEHLPFMDAYGYWRQEMESFAKSGAPNGSYTIPDGGVTDRKTGKFTPSKFAALQCRLGQEAHLHESFLLRELAADASVHEILESSQLLCEKYGISSMTLVRFVPGQGYVSHTNNGCAPQAQQALWLKAMHKSGAQPDGAANGSQPIRSETNSTTTPAGSRR